MESIISIEPKYGEIEYSGKISSVVKNLAKRIVGKETDIKAAQKLAYWVKNNILHETMPGFYQDPETTLLRGVGNCCCHTELFLQMCIAIGLDKNHRLGFVHVGSMEFNHRHFFAIFDNLLVDTDSGYGNPFGHASVQNRDIFNVTLYPMLPATSYV